MGPTRVNRKVFFLCFESGEEQIKGDGKVTQNTEIFSTKYGKNILEVGSPEFEISETNIQMQNFPLKKILLKMLSLNGGHFVQGPDSISTCLLTSEGIPPWS